MRKNIRFLSLLIVYTVFLGSAKAQNYVTIPDPNFLFALQEILPAEVFNEAGEMNADHEAVVACGGLSVSHRGIQSLEGIQYFGSLKYLDCSHNQLSSLLMLPQSLEFLDCGNNQLSSLLDLPASLGTLYCNYNYLDSLRDLPYSLLYLSCSNNQLSSLPDLPSSLEFLDCGGNQLNSLPSFPESLLWLRCENNQLSSLPSLPESLGELLCDGNQLRELPDLPQSLDTLSCSHNQLRKLPVLPELLYIVRAQENCFSTMPERPEWIATSDFIVSPNRADCIITGLASESENQSGIYPNPVEDVLYLGAVYDDARVYDLGGRELGHYSNTDQIGTTNWSSGVYLIRLRERYVRVVKQ